VQKNSTNSIFFHRKLIHRVRLGDVRLEYETQESPSCILVKLILIDYSIPYGKGPSNMQTSNNEISEEMFSQKIVLSLHHFGLLF
jgi:hypothetical protein